MVNFKVQIGVSYDDLYIVSDSQEVSEIVDYTSNNNQLDFYTLYECWKLNCNPNKVDISVIIPSTISRRLENISWRRWSKDINKLKEVDPWTIGWDKAYDITWLYGPKIKKKKGPMIKIPLKNTECYLNPRKINKNASAPLNVHLGSYRIKSYSRIIGQHSPVSGIKKHVHFSDEIHVKVYDIEKTITLAKVFKD